MRGKLEIAEQTAVAFLLLRPSGARRQAPSKQSGSSPCTNCHAVCG